MRTAMRTVGQVTMILIGTMMLAIAYNWFMIPHHLVSGGVAGVALLLRELLGLPFGLQVFVYNVPILLWGGKFLGRKFLGYTTLGVVALTVFSSLVPIQVAIPDDALLSSIFGGLLLGTGIGLSLRAGGSTGGLDIAAIALNRRFSVPFGDINLVINGIIVAMAGLLQANLETVLYTLVAMFVSGKMVDVISAGAAKKTLMIVTKHPGEVSRRINRDMGRGVTMLDARGSYTGQVRTVLLCVITRYELSSIKEIVGSVDPDAFMAVLETEQVMGRFHQYNPLARVARPPG